MIRKIDNKWWLTLTIGFVLLIMTRLVFLVNRVRKLERLHIPIRNYEDEKERLTKRYNETNMRINEIHHILSERNNNSLTTDVPTTGSGDTSKR